MSNSAPSKRPLRPLASIGALALALFGALFTPYAMGLGWAGLTSDLWPDSRFDAPDTPESAAIFLHMLTGGLISALAPLQLVPAVRARAPVLHRWSGRIIAVAALATAVSGLIWIAGQGTIGGLQMSVAFALYGLLMGLAAIQTVRFARARDYVRHRRWGLRLVVLALASWVYRIHYGIWYAITDGVASNDAFTGAFDRVQNWAFFVPYLLLLELWFWRERRRHRQSTLRQA